VFKGLTCF